VLRVAGNNLFATNVTKVIVQDLIGEQLDKSLYVLRHFFFRLSLGQRTEIKVRESTFKELNVELIAREGLNIFDRLINSKVG
jgi:hypothetical protein